MGPNRACLNLSRKLTVSQAPVEQDDMDALIATHRIQRGLSRVSIKKRKANEMSDLEKLHLKKRDLQQELKDKNFQLRCIQQLLSNDITNEVVSNIKAQHYSVLEHTGLVRRPWEVCRADSSKVSRN